MNKVIIEEVIIASLKQGLIDKSKEIIDKKFEEFNLELHDKAMVGINDIVLSIDTSSFDNTREITRDINIGIHIKFKERIEYNAMKHKFKLMDKVTLINGQKGIIFSNPNVLYGESSGEYITSIYQVLYVDQKGYHYGPYKVDERSMVLRYGA